MQRLDNPTGIIIHHSATRDTDTISFDAIAKFHTGVNGFDQIGYHFILEVVNDEPRIFTGRGLQYEGAHTKGHNNTIGICLVGNYDNAYQLGDGKLGLLVKLLHSLLILYPHLTTEDIHYHRDFTDKKTCPGSRFPSKMALKFVMSKGAN